MMRQVRELKEGWFFAFESNGQKELFNPVMLPHDWAVEGPYNQAMDQGEPQGFFDRFGIGWYRYELDMKTIDEERLYILEFGGIFEDSTVFLNGVELGGRKYGYSPFRVELNQALKLGSNEILVRVDNTKSPVDRWYSGCGIYRSVYFLDLPKAHLDPWEVVILQKIDGKDATVELVTPYDVMLQLEVYDEGKKLGSASGQGNLSLELKDLSLWSAKSPKLYDFVISSLDGDQVIDQIQKRIGFRAVDISVDGLFVNGVQTKLQGVCLHQDVGIAGNASTKEIWQERLLKLKEMGVNAIRPSHHLFPDFFLDLCDEMGFYVYEEPFDKWTAGYYGRYFDTEWERDLEVMVKRDRNRPSIIIWGVGNEVEHQGQASMLEILAMLTKKVKSLDSRPVSYAMNPHFKERQDVDLSEIEDIQKFVDEVDEYEIYDNEERIRRIAKIADIVDVISCNYMEQWFDMVHEAIPNKPILGSEVYQYFKGHLDQMQHFTTEIPALAARDKDYVLGSMIWTGYDYLGESMGWPAKGWGGAYIRTNGEERPTYHIMKSHWTDEPMVYFAVLDYSQPDEGVKEHWDIPMYASHWQFPQFHKTVIPYMIATNCDRVELIHNNKPFYPTLPSESQNGVIHGYLPWQAGKIEVLGYIGDEIVARHVVETPGVANTLRFDEKEVFIETKDYYEKQLTVRALDKDGIPCYLESAKLRFWVEGDAEILGVDNGDLMRAEGFTGQYIHLYRGAASVRVRVNKNSGRVVLGVAAAGMKQGRSVLIVNAR